MPLPSGFIAPALLVKDYPATPVIVATANQANALIYSFNGIDWAVARDGWSTNIIAHHPSVGFLIGYINGTDVLESDDGVSWVLNSDGTSRACRALLWVEELGLWIYGAEGVNPLFTSPATIAWTQRTCPTQTFVDLAWSPTEGIIVGPGSGGSGYVTSPDGINWTSRSSNHTDKTATVWVPELALFVTVCTDGDVETSEDGITWDNQGNMGQGDINDLVWSPTVGLLVAVGEGTNAVVTSPDGINWTVRNGALPLHTWNKVVWSPSLEVYIAQNSDAVNDPFAHSEDGINWTTYPLTGGITNRLWTDICAAEIPAS